MKILVAAIHYPVASGRYISRALKRMGHDVKTVGPEIGRRVWGIDVDERHVWTPDYTGEPMTNGYPDWTIWNPELIVTADSAYTLEYVPGFVKPPHILYGVDNHVRDYDLDKDWDHEFLAHSFGYRTGEDNSTWLPCAYDPEFFTPGPPLAERPVDVAMIGVLYPGRVMTIQAMQAAGLTAIAGTGALYEDYAKAYHRSKISVCVSACGDVAQRIYETAAMGNLVLSDPCHDFDKLGFVDGVHYLEYGTVSEAVEKAKWALDRPEEAQVIADAGQAWALPHTWDARCETILQEVFNG